LLSSFAVPIPPASASSKTTTTRRYFVVRALAGKLTPHLGSTLPRAFSPCGTVLDRNALQLMLRPARHFPYIDALPPAIEEALLVPLHRNAKPIGTIWVVSHDETRRFDAEDARLMTNLGRFAAGACDVIEEARSTRT
jgi:GAF domain-containing protein